MEVVDGDHVPRVTGQGTRHETAFVVNEAGDDHFHKLLRELGDWGWAYGGRLREIEQPHDVGFGSVPKSVNEEFAHYHNVSEP